MTFNGLIHYIALRRG